ncbi:MAG: rod shape-determining protein MreC [Planctomycetota bacterium]|nr:MAG: rod shape-determining protein MreC [Planctomycetota bacterium]
MSPRYAIVVLAALLALIAVAAVSGLPRALWGLAIGGADRWRAGVHALAHTPVMPDRAGNMSEDVSVHRDAVLRLAAENAELRRRIREYEGMDAELGTRVVAEQFLRARVVARSTDDGRHFIELDRGAVHGIAVGDPVMVGWSIVGVVRGERASRSLVQLLTDRQSRVAVSLYAPGVLRDAPPATSDIPAAQGVVAGSGSRHSLQVIHVEARSSVSIIPGMQVVTSGLEEYIPYGLAVGEVVEARRRPDADLWDVEVQPLRPWGSFPTVQVLRRLSLIEDLAVQ